MYIDLHVHTSRYSACGQDTPEQMVRAAVEKGVAGLVLTEHDLLWPRSELAKLQSKYEEIRLYRGMEVTSLRGDHFLVYGLSDYSEIHFGMEEARLLRTVKETGGAIILAHPFRYTNDLPEAIFNNPPHAIESQSCNIDPGLHPKILKLATQLGVAVTAASDGHSVENVGRYLTRFPQLPADEQQLAQLIRAAYFTIG